MTNLTIKCPRVLNVNNVECCHTSDLCRASHGLPLPLEAVPECLCLREKLLIQTQTWAHLSHPVIITELNTRAGEFR